MIIILAILAFIIIAGVIEGRDKLNRSTILRHEARRIRRLRKGK